MKFLFDSPMRLLFLLGFSAVLGSCNQETSVPFPENASGYVVPKTLPFTLPEGKPIEWKVLPQDSTPTPEIFKINLESLPSKPFSAFEFKSLKSPLWSVGFKKDSLESIPINLDTLKPKSIAVKKFLLPETTATSATIPSVWQGGTAAIVRLGQTEGLLGNKVFSILNDSFGNMWISTDRGLSKYNGIEFLNYNFFGKSETGAIEIIPDMALDPAGNLIISGLVTGIYRLNITLGLVEHFPMEKGFIRMDFDSKGKLWGVNNGVFILDLDTKSLSTVDVEMEKRELGGANGIHEDREGNIWIGFGQKIGVIDPARKSIRLLGDEEGLVVRTSYEFTEDQGGKIWISAFSLGAYSVSWKDQRIHLLGQAQGYHNHLGDVFTDDRERLWLISGDTVTVFDQKASLMKKIVTGAAIRDGNFPSSSIKSQDGMIWLGTDKAGVLLMNPNGLLSDYFDVENGLESNDTWGIQEDSKGRIWLANYRGINIYDPKKERIYLLQLPETQISNNYRQINRIGKDLFLAGLIGGFAIIDLENNTYSYYETRITAGINVTFTGDRSEDGRIWMGGASGLLVFDPKEKSLKKLDTTNGLVSNTAFVVKKDKKGRFWIASDAGVNLIDPKTNQNTAIQKKNGLLSDYTSMIFETSQGEILIGGDLGFSILNPELTTITHISGKTGLNPPGLYDLNESNGRIQVGSENGIIVVERPKKASQDSLWRFLNFGKSAGLPYNDHNQSTSFVSSTGQVWWGASPILVVNHQDPILDSMAPSVEIKGMNIMDQNPAFLTPSYFEKFLEKGDTLWLSDYSKGWAKDQLPKDTSYLAQNKIRWDSISPGYRMPYGLKLPYHQNSFNFTFSNHSTVGRDKIVYRYILEGADEVWSAISPKPTSRIYYNLQPGDYTFKVATRGFNGVWSEPATFEFLILPPWWQTWWAYLMFASLFGGITYAIVYVRSQWLQKENRILEEKVAHRTSQLNKTIDELKTTQTQLIQSEKMASLGELTAGIAHEIQNPLNFVNNFSEMNTELIEELEEELEQGNLEEVKALAKDIKGNEQKIIHHGKRADSIVKGMLMHSRSNTGQRELTDLNSLADEYLRLSYHGIRAKDKSFNANFKTHFDPDLPKVNVVTQDLGRVLLNLINNAFYAVNERLRQEPPDPNYKPEVIVSTRTSSTGVEISVQDNGSGIPDSIKEKIFQPFFTTKPTGSGTGLGLSLSYDIVKAHGGELQVSSQVGEGTTFKISLPLA